jgi:hypothetical protein
MFAGQLMVGGVVSGSLTVTVKLQLAGFAPPVAVAVTVVVVPTVKDEPDGMS